VSRTIGIVAAQVAPVPYDQAATLEAFERHVWTLASVFPNLDLYVFPELYLAALGSWDDRYPVGYEERIAEPVPGPLTERIGALARDVGKWLVPGSVFERSELGIHNTALAFSPDGSLVATYRKIFPWMPYETSVPGDRLTVFDIPGIGRFGLMICYDGWVPEIPRNLAWLGAEAIIQPTQTKTSDRDLELVLARANAITNQAYIISPNYGALFGTGRSIVVDPEGHVLAQGGSGEEYLTQVIDLDRVSAVRQHGTAGINRLWQQLRDLPTGMLPAYREGFAAGEVMRDLGPLVLSRSRAKPPG
jgi:formamidase